MKKLKILIVGDTARSLKDFRGKLVESLSKNNHVFVYIPYGTDPDFYSELSNWGVTVYENRLKGSSIAIVSDLHYIIKLFWVIVKVRPNVLFTYTFKPIIYGCILGKLLKIKKLVPMITGLGYTFADDSARKWTRGIVKKLLSISISGKSVKLILQNKDDGLTLKTKGIVPQSQSYHVVNGSGVDLQYYAPSDPNTDNINFLMIARLINAKGIFEYYESARIVKMLYPDVTFRLIGDHSSNVDIIDDGLLAKIKDGNVIEYIGDVTDIRPYIKNASVIVLPSYYGEGVPRSLLEAMAMQRAIITCDSVGCKETISPTQPNGFLVPPKRIPPLVVKLELYIRNPHLIILHGKNGLYWAKEKFDVDRINMHMEKSFCRKKSNNIVMSNYFKYACRNKRDFQRAIEEFGWVVYESALSPYFIDQIKDDMGKSYQVRRAIQQQNGIGDDMSGTLHHLLEQNNFSIPFISKMYCDEEIQTFLGGKYILNGINGVINRSDNGAYLNKMHRDIRTFMPDHQILIQMIVTIDDFTLDNGATHFLSGSHKRESRPEEEFFFKRASRAVTTAGSIILFNANLWHATGQNKTDQLRRALTLGFTRPFVKQQLDYTRYLGYDFVANLEANVRQVVGYNARVPENLQEYYQPPHLRMYQRDQG